MAQANNCIMLVGRAGKDPVFNTTPSGRQVAKFSLAVDRPGKDKPTDWFDIQLWGKPAEAARDLVTKGVKLSVVGSLNFEPWTDKDGNKRVSNVVNADNFQLLDPRQPREDAAPAAASTGQQGWSFEDDDIPPF